MPEGAKRLLDGVLAPSFSEEARIELNRKKGKCRLLENSALIHLGSSSLDKVPRFRYVRGGFLRQPNYTFVLDFKDRDLEIVGPQCSEAQATDLLLAWAVGSTSNSNTITLVKNGILVGNGIGQQDRVGAATLAITRALRSGHDTAGAVAYSDSFFPFPDGPETAARAGVTAIIQPGGSVKDSEVIVAVNAAGVAMVLSGVRHFRH
jgi:phosphoribosylaminoimidazolecarboxamide formyltransferase/IMP cyclohydrolase